MKYDVKILSRHKVASTELLRTKLLASSSAPVLTLDQASLSTKVDSTTRNCFKARLSSAAMALAHRAMRLIYKSKRRLRRMAVSLDRKRLERVRSRTSLARTATHSFSRAQALNLLALEPRVVFDAAAADTAAQIFEQTAAQQSEPAAEAPHDVSFESTAEDGGSIDIATDGALSGDRREIAFIDASVENADQLLSGIGGNVEVVLLDGTRDGLQQIAETLAGRSGFDAVHVLSHGAPGELRLGNSDVTLSSISGHHADDLAVIRDALSADADILFYGCDVAAGAGGAAFVAAIADATGADVAASTDATGTAELGGDWTLEATHGEVETTALALTEYGGLLAPLVVTPVGTGGVTAMTLAQQLMGDSTTIVSATLYGAQSQAGIFSGADGYTPSWLSFSSGVIFSTGHANLPTTNTVDGYSAGLTTSGVGGHADFAAIGGNSSHNASYIDISFIPDNDRLSIQFVFGSDEYNEYVYSGVSDAMAVWVNGTNIAVTPNGSPIGIDTINASGTFTPGQGPSAAPSLFVNNDLQNGGGTYATEMDGFTRTLGATITVNAGVVNTLRLGISDIGDGVFDSWLLVQADSVQANLAAQNDVVGTTLNTPVTFDVAANDIDYDGDSKTIISVADQPIVAGQTVTLASGATVKLNTDQTLTVTPATNSSLQELFTYTITDGQGNTASAYATVNIIAGTPPALDLDGSAAGTGYATTYAIGGSGVAVADVDAIVTDTNNVTRATISLGGSYAGDLLTAGTLPAGVAVDPSSTATSIVLVGNVSASTMEQAIKAVTYSNSSPSPDMTERTISVQVSEATGLSSAIAQTVVQLVALNSPPVGVPDTIPVTEDVASSLNVLANDSDPNSDHISIASASIDVNGDGIAEALALGVPTALVSALGVPLGTITVTSTGNVTVTPEPNYHGPLPQLTYVPTDGTANGAPVAVTLGPVADVNDAPVAVSPTPSGNEDTPITVALAGTDLDGSIASVTVTALPPATQGVLYLADGTTPVVAGTPLTPAQAANLVFVPAPNFNGPVPLAFTVTDDDGAVSATSPVTISVADVNDAPVAGSPAPSGNEDTPIAVALSGTDLDGSIASVTVTALPPATQGVLYLADGTTPVTAGTPLSPAQAANLVFVPAPNFNGPVPLAFTVTDDDGAVSATSPVTISVVDVNDAPVAGSPTPSGNEDTPIAVALGGTDVDGTITAVTVVTLPPAASGVLYLADGITPVVAGAPLTPVQAAALVFVPAPNFNGPVPLAFTVTDDDGAVSATSPVTISVVDVNDAPVAVSPTPSGNEDTPITVALAGTDLDGTIASVTVTALPPATQGVLYLADGITPVVAGAPLTPVQAAALVFVPAPNFNGPVPLAFTVTDDDGAVSATSPVTISVVDVNDAPVAGSPAPSGNEDTPIAVALGGTDVDGTITAVTVATLPPAASGVLYLADGITPVVAGAPLTPVQAAALVFVPAPNFNGPVPLAFTVTDDDGAVSATSPVTISVVDVNDAPVAGSPTPSGNEDTPIAVALGGTDVDGTITAVTVATLPPAASGVLYLADGITPVVAGAPLTPVQAAALVFVPAPNFNGPVPLAFTVTDDDGAVSAPSPVTISVADINDAPVATPLEVSTKQDAPVTGALTATDVDGDPLQYAGPIQGPTNGTVTIDANGEFTYTPRFGFSGKDSFVVQVSDGRGGTTNMLVSLDVSPIAGPIVPGDTAIRAIEGPVAVAQDSIVVDGIVLETLAALGLDPDQSLAYRTQGIVVGTVNALSGVALLGQIEGPGGGYQAPIMASLSVSAWSTRGAEPIATSASDLDARLLPDYSLRIEAVDRRDGADPDGKEIVVRTLLRDRILLIGIDTIRPADGLDGVVAYRMTLQDGSPLPSWIGATETGSYLAEVPLESETLSLRISALLSDGTQVVSDVTLVLATGEVVDSPPSTGRPPMLDDTLRENRERMTP